MFIVTLGDVIGIVIFLIILVGCIIYWVYNATSVRMHDKKYHSPNNNALNLDIAKERQKKEREEYMARLKTNNPKLYKKAKARSALAYTIALGAVIALCLFAAWLLKK